MKALILQHVHLFHWNLIICLDHRISAHAHSKHTQVDTTRLEHHSLDTRLGYVSWLSCSISTEDDLGRQSCSSVILSSSSKAHSSRSWLCCTMAVVDTCARTATTGVRIAGLVRVQRRIVGNVWVHRPAADNPSCRHDRTHG